MAMIFAVFVPYVLFAVRVHDSIVTRERVMTWVRRTFAGGFALLGAPRMRVIQDAVASRLQH